MIRVEAVGVDVGGVRAIDGVTLAIGPGEAWALIGRCGSGRSTLLAAIAGTIPLAAGDVVIEGVSLRDDPRSYRRLVGYVPAGLVAWPAIRAGDFLELFAAEGGLAGKPLAAAVERGLAAAGLSGGAQVRVDRLPDGAAKRLLVARALLFDPRVLVLDDPFRALDPAERRDVERLIADMMLVDRCIVAACDDGVVPSGWTHLALVASGRLVRQGVATPEGFGARRYRVRFAVPGRADEAVAIFGSGPSVRAVDPDTVEASFAGSAAIAAAVATLVDAGIVPSGVGYHPAWSAQWLEDDLEPAGD